MISFVHLAGVRGAWDTRGGGGGGAATLYFEETHDLELHHNLVALDPGHEGLNVADGELGASNHDNDVGVAP